ncbi:MAG: Fur family transcriptional regulator [Candidatus Izemoplasmataceae bacterium]|jgi:Fur family transcriptional regulator, peroxide stress response regulator
MQTAELLMQLDIKPSYTRMMIFEYLKDNMTHPTVDEIYQSLVQELPTLSKTTVYNTLKLFMEKHLVQELVMEQQKHYDLISTPHAHFQCERCDTIFDIDMVPPYIDKKYQGQFKVSDTQLTYRGICEKCQKTA